MIRCKICGALKVDDKWYPPGMFKKDVDDEDIEIGLCPGDERIQDQQIDGIVELFGNFLDEHDEEISNLIENTAQERLERNIAARIFKIEREPNKMVIETTEPHLAAAIGRAMDKAFDGELNIKWRDGTKQVRVEWRRDD